MKFADGKESGGNYEEAIKFFEKALDVGAGSCNHRYTPCPDPSHAACPRHTTLTLARHPHSPCPYVGGGSPLTLLVLCRPARLLPVSGQAAKKSEDVAAEGRACYRLGTAYLKSKSNYDVAIKYLSQYVSRRPPTSAADAHTLPSDCGEGG